MIEGLHHSKELEAAILGVCMLERDALGRTYGAIKTEMFYWEDNQEVHANLVEMFQNNIPIDLVTVFIHMTEKEIVLKAGNIPWYLCSLSRDVICGAHLEYHCYKLKTMWQKRELERLTQSGIDTSVDVRQNVQGLNDRLNEILGTDVKKDWYNMTELMHGLMVHQEEIASGKKQFITSGFKQIDRMNGGFSEGEMIVIGARPSIGKSAFAAVVATAMAAQQKSVGFISLEMNNDQIAGRLSSLETGIDFKTIYHNLFTDENQREYWYQIVTKKSINLPIYVSDKTRVDISEIRAKAMKLKREHGCHCLIVDYIQLVDTSDATGRSNREQEIAKISRGIKLMAMEMKMPVIILCQLNREVTKRQGAARYPKLSDIRESGSLEQDADIVMMLHRDWISGFTQTESGGSTENEADLLGVKWRNGSPFHLKLNFDPPTMKFSEQMSSGFIPVKFDVPYTPGEKKEDEDPF